MCYSSTVETFPLTFLKRPSVNCAKVPASCAHKTTATAILKPVSHAWQPRAGLQWRKADQPTEMA